MARIRSVKPEMWTDQKLARLSRDARLLYIALWNFADEQSRMVGDPRQVKGLCLALDDDLTPADIDRLLGELASLGRVIRYEVDGERYLHLPKLACHQRLDERQPSRYPPPPEHATRPPENPPPPAPTDFSGQVRGDSAQVNGDSGEVDVPRARGRSRLQVAGSMEQVASNTVVAQDEPARPVGVHPSLVEQGFAFWQEQTGKHKARLDPKRRRKLQQAFEHYPPEDVFDALRGWKNSPHHCGQNDRGTVYNDLELLLRDAKHIEGFRDLARDGPTVAPMTKQRRQLYENHQALDAWAKEVDSRAGNGMAGHRDQAQRELPRPRADRA